MAGWAGTEVHSIGPCQWINSEFRWWRLVDWGRREDGFGWNITKGQIKREIKRMQLLKMPTCWWEKGKKHILIITMLTKHNYANCHHYYMCTSLGLTVAGFQVKREATPNGCYTFICIPLLITLPWTCECRSAKNMRSTMLKWGGFL